MGRCDAKLVGMSYKQRFLHYFAYEENVGTYLNTMFLAVDIMAYDCYYDWPPNLALRGQGK